MKKIILMIIVLMLAMQVLAMQVLAIDDNTVSDDMVKSVGTAPELSSETYDLTERPDKNQLSKPDSEKNIFEKLFGLTEQSFFTSKFTVKEVGKCTSTKSSDKFLLIKGGYTIGNKLLQMGAKCSNGQYVRFFAQISGQGQGIDFFDKLWLKSSDTDLMKFADYDWASNGIFDKYNVNEMKVYYYCYDCKDIKTKTGCTNKYADNYDSSVNVDDGSCKFSKCKLLEGGQGLIVSNGKSYSNVCVNNKELAKYSCGKDVSNPESHLILEYVNCPAGCSDGECKQSSCQEEKTDIYTKGYSTLNGEKVWDKCHAELPDVVNEFKCDSTDIMQVSEICPDGYNCNNGACVVSSSGTGIVLGCTDTQAENFQESATEDDGSCIYGKTTTCTEPLKFTCPTGVEITIADCANGQYIQLPDSCPMIIQLSLPEDGKDDKNDVFAGFTMQQILIILAILGIILVIVVIARRQ